MRIFVKAMKGMDWIMASRKYYTYKDILDIINKTIKKAKMP